MWVVGLMSGTSADGVDAALCEVAGGPPHLRATVAQAVTVPYPPELRRRILAACQPATSGVADLCRLNVDLADTFAAAALAVIAAAGLSPVAVDLIGSHGQTVWHQVGPEGRVQATLQLGEAAVIAERTGVTTVSNVRARDVAAGGQGAPLTGYVDWLLLRHPTGWRAVQNIGGMANVTFLPPLADAASAPLAFDTGPGNALIDAAVQELTGDAQPHDVDGALAARGRVDAAWLATLLAHPYFARRPPKTTGRETFGVTQARALVAEGRRRGLAAPDIVATLTALTADSIAAAYARFAPAPLVEVILGGGGRHNQTLVARLRERLAPAPVRAHEALGLPSDHKEALVVAVLAHETWHDRPATLPALTGATHATVLGQITPGRNYAALCRRTWGSGPGSSDT